MPTSTKNLSQKFLAENFNETLLWSKTRKDGDCIVWTGARNKAGYGIQMILRWPFLAHRVSFTLKHGDIPPGHLIRHSCDNPPCVNPNHLSSGTYRDNAADTTARGRGRSYVGAEFKSTKTREAPPLLLRVESLNELARLLGIRRAKIIADYFGLYGQGQRKPSAIAVSFGVTRQRVHQIVSRGLLRVASLTVFSTVKRSGRPAPR